MMKKGHYPLRTLGIAIGFLPAAAAWATNGHVLHGVGSVNQAMGGAGIATSIDGIGSNHSNVASTSFLERSSIEFGAELFIADRTLSSSFADGTATGKVDSKTREAVIPGFGLVYKIQDDWTFGFSAVGIGGFGVDYPANPSSGDGKFSFLSLPQTSGGFGPIYSNYLLLQMTPSVSYKVTKHLSIGVGFNLDYEQLAVDPWPATPPNASGYPSGTHAAGAWGQGFTVGADYKLLPNLALGFVFKSPQWFNELSFNSQYPDGTPTKFNFRLDYPMIVGAGFSYKPVDDLILAADLKWINYKDTNGFQAKNFGASYPNAYVRGFGWENIWAVGVGGQYQVHPRLALRAGYSYSDNPIPTNQQFFNVFAPAIVQHHITAGAGFKVTPDLELNMAYYHVFENTESGPFISDGRFIPVNQPFPGSKITNRLSEDSVSVQVAYKFQ